jgi:rubrerythrin
MTVEEAIKTALDLEKRVRKVYADAETESADEVAGRFLDVLAREEGHHVAYLQSRLDEWTRTGKVTPEALATAVPSKQRIAIAVHGLKQRMRLGAADQASALTVLKRALDVEIETSDFYRKVVAELPDPGAKAMFARFLEIEEGHQTIVSAEIDSINGAGFWFDMREFDLEGG